MLALLLDFLVAAELSGYVRKKAEERIPVWVVLRTLMLSNDSIDWVWLR